MLACLVAADLAWTVTDLPVLFPVYDDQTTKTRLLDEIDAVEQRFGHEPPR